MTIFSPVHEAVVLGVEALEGACRDRPCAQRAVWSHAMARLGRDLKNQLIQPPVTGRNAPVWFKCIIDAVEPSSRSHFVTVCLVGFAFSRCLGPRLKEARASRSGWLYWGLMGRGDSISYFFFDTSQCCFLWACLQRVTQLLSGSSHLKDETTQVGSYLEGLRKG